MSRRSKRLAAQRYEALASSNGHASQLLKQQPRWREPPNDGRAVVQHIDTFSAQMSSMAKAYYNPDEAYQQNKTLQRGMLLDPVVMQPLRTRQMNVALLDWAVKPEDEDDPHQKQVCDRLTRTIGKIRHFVKLRMALMEGIWFGRYGVEVRWGMGWDRKSNSPTLELSPGGNMPNGWLPVHGDKLRLNRVTGQLGIGVRAGTQIENVSFGDEFPIKWLDFEERQCFLFHTHEILDGDFFDPRSAGSVMGLGLRHRLWWAWFFKQNLAQWVMEFAQRVGTGITVYYFDQDNPESFQKVKEAAESNGNGSILLVPRGPEGRTRGAGVERIEPSTAGAQFLQSLLDESWERKIKGMIAGETLTSETGATGLGSNVAEKHAETKNQYQQFDAVNLDETLTRDLLFPMLNYPQPWTEDWTPRFESAVMETDPKAKMDAAQSLYNMGAEIVEDEARETAGLRKPKKGEKTLSKAKSQPQQPGGGTGGGMPGGDAGGDPGDDDAAFVESLMGGGGEEAANEGAE